MFWSKKPRPCLTPSFLHSQFSVCLSGGLSGSAWLALCSGSHYGGHRFHPSLIWRGNGCSWGRGVKETKNPSRTSNSAPVQTCPLFLCSHISLHPSAKTTNCLSHLLLFAGDISCSHRHLTTEEHNCSTVRMCIYSSLEKSLWPWGLRYARPRYKQISKTTSFFLSFVKLATFLFTLTACQQNNEFRIPIVFHLT